MKSTDDFSGRGGLPCLRNARPFRRDFRPAICTFGAVAVMSLQAIAHIEVYPGPQGIDASDDYIVEVISGETAHPSFTYKNTSDDPADEHIEAEVMAGIEANPALKSHYLGAPMPASSEYEGIGLGLPGGPKVDLHSIRPTRRRSVSFTTISFDGTVTVRVRSLKGSVQSAQILPSSREIEAKADGDTLAFSLSEPAKLAVVINGDFLNPLFVFADAPEMDVPVAGAPGVLSLKAGADPRADLEAVSAARIIRFEPGVHDIGIGFPVSAGQTLYLAGGAYLHGTFHGYMVSGVSFRGRGILSGERIERGFIQRLKQTPGTMWERMQYHSINMLSEQNKTRWNAYAPRAGLGCDDLLVEGITLLDPGHFYLRLTGNPITIRNVKMVGGWHYNSDGVSTIGQANTTVFDCFFHCNDDAIYVRPDDVHIHHCVFWQGNNGAVFQFSWGGDPYDQGGGYIHDIDIIHCDQVREANNRAIIGSRKAGPGDIRDIRFKDIRIEGPVWRFLRLNTYAEDPDRGYPGSIDGITFENISITGPVINKSEIMANCGAPEGVGPLPGGVRNILFRNVTINGTPLTAGELLIGDTNVANIRFEP
ncbi:MAG: hypothetical protein R3F07_17075 [Opitutaceae bacterium]